MSKIGVLTVHRAVNFGAVLQMYGLYTTLRELGSEVNIIDYRSKVIEDREAYFKHIISKSKDKNILRNLYETIDSIFSLSADYQKKKKFDCFLHKYFILSSAYGFDTISEIEEKYDAIIAGSDQIWNRCLNDDDVFFLSFVKDTKKKYSYAASFGNEMGFAKKKDINFKLLNSFSEISVREEIGIKELEKKTKKQIMIHIDPAFLLNQCQWSEISKKPKRIKQDEQYILLYWASRSLKRYAQGLAKKNGWKIYDICEGIPRGLFKNLSALNPAEFIWAIKHAKFVCTTSFHGMVFSLIYHVPFKVDFDNNLESANMRQRNILELLEMQGFNLQTSDTTEKVNWDIVDGRIRKKADEARQYLKRIVDTGGRE